MFAILVVVQLFAGKFYSCNDHSRTTDATCTGTFVDYSRDTALHSSFGMSSNGAVEEPESGTSLLFAL